MSVNYIVDLLRAEYKIREFQPHHDPLAELIQTILSQNTSDKNSRPAFKALQDTFGSWEAIITAEIDEIADSIKGGGLGQIKAKRIQTALLEIKKRRSKIDLSFLSDMQVKEAREWLKQLPGVGNKTANCVLLFALGKPALPVDTHIFRLSKRLGLIPQQASLDEAHELLENIVPVDDIYEFHVSMIEHGRQVCKALHPHCSECIIKSYCLYYKQSTSS